MSRKNQSDRRPQAHAGEKSLSRRTVIKAGLGAGAAGLLVPNGALPALAQQKTLGTFPAGAAGSSVFVGAICPLTGPYSASGKDMQRGFELAVEHLNNGSPVTEAMPSLKGQEGRARQEDRISGGGFRKPSRILLFRP